MQKNDNWKTKRIYKYYIHFRQKWYFNNLENVEQEKDIGVIIDSNLEFDKHINAKINKANSMFSIIRRSFQFLNPQTFTPLYKSLVRSHLDYASSVWNPYKQKHIEAIENVQKRATRQLPNMSKLSYEERLRKYYIWLQSDAAFYYPRLDKCSFSVGMFCATCDVTRRPLGRLATASSLEGNVFRHGERGLVASVLGKFLMGQDLSQIYERYH